LSALLANKTAIVYGGGGAIGGAAARVFAREGARVFLAGRTQSKLALVARDIESQGGTAEIAALDLLDESAVRACRRGRRRDGRYRRHAERHRHLA